MVGWWVLQIEPCDWLTRFMRVILPCLSLVDAGLNSVNRFYSKDSKVCVQKCTNLAVSLCTVHLYRAVRSSDHGDLSRKIPLTMRVCPIKKLLMFRRNLMGLTKSLMELEELNQITINNNVKGSQLKRLRRIVIQLRMI